MCIDTVYINIAAQLTMECTGIVTLGQCGSVTAMYLKERWPAASPVSVVGAVDHSCQAGDLYNV